MWALPNLRLTIPLILYDLGPGEKEIFFRDIWYAAVDTDIVANIADHQVQDTVIAHLKVSGFDGRISTEDRSVMTDSKFVFFAQT